jgi:hypothetical protein
MATTADIDGEADVEQAPTFREVWDYLPGITDSTLHKEYLNRMAAGRDIRAVITAASETGVGKTTLALVLAIMWDIHGWSPDKVTLDPREYAVKYDEVPPGSVLLLDEAEQAVDRRRGMTSDNLEVSHDFAAKRYRQVIGLLTAPSKGWLDDRIGIDMVDYWIQCQETDEGLPKGEAKVYRLKNNEHYESDYSKKTEIISWPNMDWHPAKRKLDAVKRERMEGSTDRRYWHVDEVEDLKSNYWNKCMQKTRFGMVRAMYEHGLTQQEIADITTAAEDVNGIGQRRVSDLVNAESFEDVYDNNS